MLVNGQQNVKKNFFVHLNGIGTIIIGKVF